MNYKKLYEDLLKQNLKLKYEQLKERNIMLLKTIENMDNDYQELIKTHKIRLDMIYRLTRDIQGGQAKEKGQNMEELLKSYLKNKEDINKYRKEIWRINADEPQARNKRPNWYNISAKVEQRTATRIK